MTHCTFQAPDTLHSSQPLLGFALCFLTRFSTPLTLSHVKLKIVFQNKKNFYLSFYSVCLCLHVFRMMDKD